MVWGWCSMDLAGKYQGLATSQLSQDGFLFLTNLTSNNLYIPLDDKRYPNSIIVSFLIYRVKIHFGF